MDHEVCTVVAHSGSLLYVVSVMSWPAFSQAGWGDCDPVHVTVRLLECSFHAKYSTCTHRGRVSSVANAPCYLRKARVVELTVGVSFSALVLAQTVGSVGGAGGGGPGGGSG